MKNRPLFPKVGSSATEQRLYAALNEFVTSLLDSGEILNRVDVGRVLTGATGAVLQASFGEENRVSVTGEATVLLPMPSPKTIGVPLWVNKLNGTGIMRLTPQGGAKINGIASGLPQAAAGLSLLLSDATDWYSTARPVATGVAQSAADDDTFVFTDRPEIFGGGQDGNLSVATGITTLTRPTFYRTVTLSGSAKINMAGFPLFIQHFDASNAPAGAIEWTPNNGGNGTAGSSAGNEGGAALAATLYLGGSGVGGGGGDPSTGNGNNGIAGSKPSSVVAYGGAGGTGGNGGTGAMAAGSGAAGGGADTADMPGWLNHLLFAAKSGTAFNYVLFGGGSGGGGGGGGSGDNAGHQGGSGAGGGSGGGACCLCIGKITAGASTPASVVRMKGGNGGNGSDTASPGFNTGGGGGGAGGGGGFAYCILGGVVGQTVSNFFDASGGDGGTGGAGSGGGTSGASGAGGAPGRIQLMHLAKNTTTVTTGSAAVGAAGGVCRTDLVI